MKLHLSTYSYKNPNMDVTNLSKLKLILFTMFCATLLFIVTSSRYLTGSESFGVVPSEIPKPTVELNEEFSHQINLKLQELASFDKFNSFPLVDKHMKDDIYRSMTLETFTDPLPYLENYNEEEYSELNYPICSEKLAFPNEIKLTKQEYLPADLQQFLDILINMKPYYNMIEKAKSYFISDLPEKKKWFRFAGSSIWLPQFKCHYMVSRYLYSPNGVANHAFASFLYIQLFDSDWKELPPNTTLDIPFEQTPTDSIFKFYKLKQRYADFRNSTYPQILPIPFDYKLPTETKKYYYGPEDPRILLRTNPLGFDEPLIVFNMKGLKLTKRVMYSYLPFSNTLKLLKKRQEPFANIEKNWTPFKSVAQPSRVQTTIHFIYSMIPLEVLACDIDSGLCDILQKPAKHDYNYVGGLRGGTQLVSLPLNETIPSEIRTKLPIPKNRQVYIGWARTHLNNCGCGDSMYRPNFITLVEDYDEVNDKYYYKIGDISGYFDFAAKIEPWSKQVLDEEGNLYEKAEQCEGRNVLIPNSIAYWDVESIQLAGIEYHKQNFQEMFSNGKVPDFSTNEIVFNDYMGVTLSSADRDVSIVHVKGLLNYILQLPSLIDDSLVVNNEVTFQKKGHDLNVRCAMIASKEYCKSYAIKHGVKIDENPDET